MATPPFKYQPMFEKGKDTTEYYLLTKDYVSVSEFEGNPILKIEKEGLTAMANAAFREAVEKAEDSGATSEELRTLLGRGRAKKGIFEGDLEEGELEIGQVSAIISRRQSVAEVMNELVESYRQAVEKKYLFER